mgnify:CR=1 FL=1
MTFTITSTMLLTALFSLMLWVAACCFCEVYLRDCGIRIYIAMSLGVVVSGIVFMLSKALTISIMGGL